MITHSHRDPALIGGLGSVSGVYLRTGTPSTISGLKLWLAAWDEAFANNDPVGTMRDGSGNGADCTQSSSSLKPTFKTGVIHSKPAYYFDGSDDYVNVPDIFATMTAGEVFIVLQGDTNQGVGTANTGLWAMPGTNDNENVPWVDGNIYDGWFSTVRKSCGNPGSIQTWHTYNVISTSSEYTALRNGTQFFTTASNTPGGARNNKTLGRSSLGSGYLFQGWIAELIIYDNKLSSGNRSAIYSYINGLYGI